MNTRNCFFGLVLFLLGACQRDTAGVIDQASEASIATQEYNQQFAPELDLSSSAEFEQATRGLIAEAPLESIEHSQGGILWEPSAYGFIQGKAPATVNPSLWRQAALNNIRGLFRVTDGVYQLRGFDLANMTIIEGDTGWILIDPLTTIETAGSALRFAQAQLGAKPITGIIFTHSHIDHFGGVMGVVSPADLEVGNIVVVAPEGFMEAATSENIVTGPAMTRRAMFMYGKRLPRSVTGHLDSGLGKEPVFGSTSILTPTITIDQLRQHETIDGVEFIFQNAPGSEAPAELMFYLPAKNAFCGAEVVSRTQHNLYTLRGAKVRNALSWSKAIENARTQFSQADIYFGSHHWPIWGRDHIQAFLTKQADLYRFIHDQTLRYANQGSTPKEIAEKIRIPSSLSSVFYNRGYYGTLSHNSKAVYQYYFGWYDGNPANLNPLPPSLAGKKYLAYMGGADAVVKKARDSFAKGEYRWVAEVLNHVIFAEPTHTEAKRLLADAYQQLAYQAESAPWRDTYLTASYELLNGPPSQGVNMNDAIELLRETPVEHFMQALSVRLKAEDAEDLQLVIGIHFTDIGQTFTLQLRNSVLHYRSGEIPAGTNARLSITHPLFIDLLVGRAGLSEILGSEDIRLEGSKLDFLKFISLFDTPKGNFPIVEP
ncbi:alkyl/aryl-sulfatase [Microbulbifer sp. 2304DJ12-6]|uniref:alkyl/aryl-sulfatase n=1 Tax=Microbulbifer sp. 2304DJ12-6 TaxID=3233340 RepID=UPI0039AFDD10